MPWRSLSSNLPHLSTFCASFFPFFFPLPTVPFLNPSPSSDLKTPPFPRGNAIFRGWAAARVLEGVTPQKKEGISLKNGAKKLVSYARPCCKDLYNIQETGLTSKAKQPSEHV